MSRSKIINLSVSRLKVHIAKYLRLVRAGSEIIVTDHKLPIARVIPLREEPDLNPTGWSVTPPSAPFRTLLERSPLPPQSKANSLKYLLEDRAKR